MARPPDLERRRELLDALVAEFAAGGIGDRPLREIAGAVGTSHRMLLHHFGSRSELLLAIVEEVENHQRELLRDLPTGPAEGVAAMWDDVRRPELRAFERLFFECYARGVQGEEPFARMVPAAVDIWLTDVDVMTDGSADPALARLGLAVIRGLLLDLVATDDDAGVDAAAQAFIGLVSAFRAHVVQDRHLRAGLEFADGVTE
jgi:AcrR family transcriptional regulator